MRQAIVAFVVLLLTACASFFSAVGPGQVTIKDRITVNATSPWNRYDVSASDFSEMWTTDGLPLDNLWFYAGVPDGEPLKRTYDSRQKKLPKFQAGMTPTEVVEMMETYITADGSTFKLERLAPATLAGGPGFRFDFRILRKQDEVELRGVGFASIQREKLYMMLYTAPSTYYFQKNLTRIEAIAGSLTIKK